MNYEHQPVAIVTGASSGIGRAIFERLTRTGMSVVGADLNPVPDVRRLDVGDEESWRYLVEDIQTRYGRLDILVNNAGIGHSAPVDEMSLEDWHRVTRVNLDGTFLGIRAAAPLMKRSGGGSIINIASVMAQVASKGASAYCASKSGVVGLTRAAAVDLAEDGIRVVCVQPGFIETPLLAGRLSEEAERRGKLEAATPAARLGRVEEIAAAVAFLASGEAGFVTGTSLVIDGGYTAL